MANRYNRKYPWDKWFERARFTAVQGKDYTVSTSSMIQTIRQNASIRGLSIRVEDQGVKVTVRVVR